MDNKKRVLEILKPKVASLGFSAKEVESAAEAIAGNLKLAGDENEEAITEAVNVAADAALPLLRLSQAAATRIVEAQRRKATPPEEAQQANADEPQPERGARETAAPSKPKRQSDDMPPWAMKLIGTMSRLSTDIESMKTAKTSGDRRALLEGMLKDTGAFGQRTLKSFDRMTFEDDEDFDAFRSEVEADLKTYNKERADAGLSALGRPPAILGGGDKTITDAQIENIVSRF